MVQTLISLGADINHHDIADNYVAFHIAAMNGKLDRTNESLHTEKAFLQSQSKLTSKSKFKMIDFNIENDACISPSMI